MEQKVRKDMPIKLSIQDFEHFKLQDSNLFKNIK